MAALAAQLGHLVAHEVDGGCGRRGGGVGREALARDQDGLVLQVGAGVEEGRETRTAAAPPSEVGQHCSFVRGSWIMVDFMILLEGVYVLELRVWVLWRVRVVDAGDFGEVFSLAPYLGRISTIR